MRISHVIGCCIGMAVSTHSVGQQLEWLSSYASPLENIEARELMILQGSAGLLGYGTAGGTGSTWDFDGNQISVSGVSDMLLFEMNGQGEVQWAEVGGGPCDETDPWDDRPIEAILDNSTGRMIVVGNYSGDGSFGALQLAGLCTYRNMFVCAYSEGGTALWASRATGDILPEVIVVGPDGNVHAFGKVNATPAWFIGTPDIAVQEGGFHASYDIDGVLVNAERVLATGEVYDAMHYGSDLVLCGVFANTDTLWGAPLTSNAPISAGFLCRSIGVGAIAWSVVCNSSSQASFADCVELSNGDIAAAGFFVNDVSIGEDTLYSTPGHNNRFLARFSSSGELRWIKHVSSPDFFLIRSLLADDDNGFYLHGNFSGSLSIDGTILPSSTSRDTYVALVDSAGRWTEALMLGRTVFSSGVGLVINEDGVFVSSNFDSTLVIGSETFEPTHPGWPDLFVAKFDGLAPVTGIQTLGLNEDRLNVYANPNNGICTLDLPSTIRRGSALRLVIYDNTGRLVQRVPLSISEQGTVRVDIQAQAKGLYHLELLDGGRRYTGTIVFE